MWTPETPGSPNPQHAEGFAALNARIGEAAERAGRDPATLRRSVCVFVQLGGAGEREAGVAPVQADELPARLREYEQAGADEVILVASPITEASVRALAPSQCGVASATAVAGRKRPCAGRCLRCGVVERAFEAPPA
jgi:hypothetical protein